MFAPILQPFLAASVPTDSRPVTTWYLESKSDWSPRPCNTTTSEGGASAGWRVRHVQARRQQGQDTTEDLGREECAASGNMASRYSELEFGRTGTSASSYDPLTRPEGLRISPSSFSSFPTPKAMSIPGAKTHDEPPPPLPPPRHVPVDGLMVFDPLERDNNPENYHLRDRSHDEGYHSVGSSRLV